MAKAFAYCTYNQNGMEDRENEEIIMDKKELIISIGALQGLKIDPSRASNMSEPGGVWDMIQLIRSILFQVDVVGARPQDDLRFDVEEVEP